MNARTRCNHAPGAQTMESALAAQFLGAFAASATADQVEVSPGAPRQGLDFQVFPGGFLAHTSDVSLVHNGDMRCLAQGEPRFDDPALAAIASEQGGAVAWLEAFRRHGLDAPAAVKGRFAVVVLDEARREAWMASDRFGTWPICHAEQDGLLCFADRADSVPLVDKRISAQAIYEYLYFHVIPAPATIYDGIHRLEAGHVLHWRQGKTECRPYWRARFGEHRAADLEDSKQAFRELVRAAVERESAGHSVGAFLSGGTDSSTVSGMLCKVLGQPARTYSIGFDANGYDEMAYARIAARHYGTEHHEYYVTPDDLLEGIPHVATAYDQPFGNSSAVPAWICASRARQDGVDKMLAGDGGDELFGGNTRYAKQRIFGHYLNVPGLLRKGLLEPVLSLPGMDRIPLLRKGVSYVEQARVPMPDRIQMYNMLQRLGLQNVFTPDFLAGIDSTRPISLQRGTWHAAEAETQINRMLAFDWKYTLADNDLPKVIGTTRLAGVDVGFPLLSDELLAFSLDLPPEWKLKGLSLRWFFKEALRGFLPDEIIAKKKHGFGLPFGVWACQHAGLKALAADALGSFKTRGIVRPHFIDELLDTHLPAHPGYYGEMVWIMMMMEFWMRQHTGAQLPDF